MSDDLISTLTEETCKCVEESADKILAHEELYNHYLAQIDKQSDSWKINYVESISCFRMEFNDQVLDFPDNWSIFSSVKDLLIKFSVFEIELTRENDEDLILDVIEPISGSIDVLKFKYRDGDLKCLATLSTTLKAA